MPGNSGQPLSDPPLTQTQREVVRLCALGCRARDVAAILDMSVSAVEKRKALAMRRLGVDNLAELTRAAIREGISPLDDELTIEEVQRINEARRSAGRGRAHRAHAQRPSAHFGASSQRATPAPNDDS